jgi:hypothetical protein
MMSDLDKPVWGVPAISEIINRSTTKTYYLLTRAMCPAERSASSGPRLRVSFSLRSSAASPWRPCDDPKPV